LPTPLGILLLLPRSLKRASSSSPFATASVLGSAKFQKSLGGAETVTYSQKDLSDGIKTLLQQYRLVTPVAGIRPMMALASTDTTILREHPVITAHLAGEERCWPRLRDMPVAIKSGLVRAITKLGIDLQRKVQQDELTGQMLTARSGSLMSSIDLRVDQGATVVAATVFTDSAYAGAHEYGFAGTVNVREGLRPHREWPAPYPPKCRAQNEPLGEDPSWRLWLER